MILNECVKLSRGISKTTYYNICDNTIDIVPYGIFDYTYILVTIFLFLFLSSVIYNIYKISK